jgi:aspartokinase
VKKPLQKFKLRGINIKSDMTELTFANSPANRKLLYGYFASGSEENLLSINTSNREITVVVPQAQVERFRQAVSPLQTIFEKKDLSAVCIDFQPEYVMEPYLLYYLIQQITLQNINIWELASTYTEIIFYVEEKDVSLAFDTLYRKFMLR